jgi:hypothetical protein
LIGERAIGVVIGTSIIHHPRQQQQRSEEIVSEMRAKRAKPQTDKIELESRQCPAFSTT